MKLFKKRKANVEKALKEVAKGDVDSAVDTIKEAMFQLAEDTLDWAEDTGIIISDTELFKANSNRTKLMLAYTAAPDGLTDEQTATLTGVTVNAVGTARRQLTKAGLVEPSLENRWAFKANRRGHAVLDVIITNLCTPAEPTNQ